MSGSGKPKYAGLNDASKKSDATSVFKWFLRVVPLLLLLVVVVLLIVIAVHQSALRNEHRDHSYQPTNNNQLAGAAPTSAFGAQELPFTLQKAANNETDLATFCFRLGPVSKLSCGNNMPCLVKFDEVISVSPLVSASNGNKQLLISQRNFYTIRLTLRPQFRCAFMKLRVAIVDVANSKRLADGVASGAYGPLELEFSTILNASARIAVVLENAQGFNSDMFELSGVISKTSDYDDLVAITQYDSTVKVRYVPFRPASLPADMFQPQHPSPISVFPWNASVIPASILASANPAPGALLGYPNRDAYGKHQSVPFVLGYYLGLDMRAIDPKDPKLSIFLTDLKDRGASNYRKKVYMTALTSGIVEKYTAKTDTFLNEVYSSFTTYGRPVLSSFQPALVKYFLAAHVGYDEYPDYVIKYFGDFINIIGFADSNAPGRDEEMLFATHNIDKVRAYFAQRSEIVKATQDTSSIIYYWHQAGLDTDGLVMEAVHNIVAFSQFNHVLYLLINDKLTGTSTPLGPIKYNFFTSFKNAATEVERLNVIRELYRLLVPNGASFSSVHEAAPADPSVVIQSRHLHLPIMATAAAIEFQLQTNVSNPAAHFAYNPNQYVGYNTDFSETACPFISNVNVHDVATQFGVSPLDGETLTDKCNEKMFPVFPLPKYAPFGLGYRRCAGEAFVYFVTLRLVDKLKDLSFVYKPINPNLRLIPLAPFTTAPDNIFVM